MNPFQRRTCWLAALLLVLGHKPISAHDLVSEQIVEMTLEQQGDRLLVALHVPAAIAGDPSLPRLLDGRDAAALEERLQIVGADIARNLDIQQGDTTLQRPAAMVRRGSDGASIDVELRYPVRANEHDFSARLNAFGAKDGPVRTNARYRPQSGREQAVSITGPPTRVAFDPPLSAVLPSFAVRGLRALFDGGDQLLFLVCLLLPMRRSRSVITLYAAAAFAQAAVIALSVAGPAIMARWLPDAAMVAASAIVIAALQNVARARLRWVLPLTLAFGALNAWTFGNAADIAAPLAGAHRVAAMLAFGGVVLLGELWIGAIVWAFRAWLDDRGLPERLVALLGSAIVAHSALHRVMERAQIVAQDGSFGGGRAVQWLILIWVGAMLIAAAANAVSGTPARAQAS